MTARRKDQKRGRKSYYHTIRIRFLMVFLVPLLAILMMFAVTYKTVQNQIVVASNNTLRQFFRYIDGAAEEANDLCVSIAYATDFQQYSKLIVENPEKNSFYLSQIQQRLKSHASDKYYDIFAYYPAIDRVVSGIKGTLDLDRYCEVYYKKGDPLFLEAFRAIAENEEKKPTWYGLDDGQNSFLCVSLRQSRYRTSEHDCIVVVVLNPDYVTEWISGIDDDARNGIFFMQNGKGELLYSNAPDSVSEDYNAEDDKCAQAYQDSYMTLTEYSDTKDISYSYAIPYTYFQMKMRGLWMISGFSIAILLIAGIYTIRKQSRKTYQPIENVINILEKQEEAAYDGQTDTEFEYLKKILDKKRENINDLSRNVSRGVKTKKENFIISLLNGTNSNPKNADNIFHDNGVILCSDLFCVVAFQCAQPENTDERIRFFAVSNVMEEIFNRNNKGYMVPIKKDLYVLLVNLAPREDALNMQRLLNEGLDFLEKYIDIKFTLGVSTLRNGMAGIHTAYEEAMLALKYRFLLGEEIIIYYSDIAARKYEDIQSSELEMLRLVTTWLSGEAGDISSDELVARIFEKCRIDHNSSMEMMEYFKYDTITMFKRVLLHEGIWSDEWKHRLMPFFNQSSLTEFMVYFSKLLTILGEEKHEKDKDMDVCVKVQEYIEQNYADEQLTVTFLGDMTGMDSSYLSKKFKEKYNCTISEYITKIRINNAKEQLKGTQMSIKEIAQSSGFLNSNSFIRTFKRNEGLTPGAYRDMLTQ